MIEHHRGKHRKKIVFCYNSYIQTVRFIEFEEQDIVSVLSHFTFVKWVVLQHLLALFTPRNQCINSSSSMENVAVHCKLNSQGTGKTMKKYGNTCRMASHHISRDLGQHWAKCACETYSNWNLLFESMYNIMREVTHTTARA